MKRTHLDIRLERSPDGGRPRYYEILLGADLFGAAMLQRRWGGVGRAGGQSRLESYPTLAAARRATSACLRRKRSRGYRKARLQTPTS